MAYGLPELLEARPEQQTCTTEEIKNDISASTQR